MLVKLPYYIRMKEDILNCTFLKHPLFWLQRCSTAHDQQRVLCPHRVLISNIYRVNISVTFHLPDR